jgi:phosphoglycerate dehydrogenase-like enzyme
MAMQVLVLVQHAPQAARLGALLGPDYTVEGLPALPDGEVEAEAVVATRLTEAETARLRCRLLQVAGAGLDGIALDALRAEIRLANVYGHEAPMAEYVIWAILDHCLNTAGAPAALHTGTWAQAYFGRRLRAEASGGTLGIVGFGHIGAQIAPRARALGLRMVAITRSGAPVAEADETVPVEDLYGCLPGLDYLVLACPLTPRGLIDAATLAQMRPTAVLINVARAEVADEADLFGALHDGRIAAAYLDVWYRYPCVGETEVAPSRFPFHELANVRCTPHISAWSEKLLERRYALIARNIVALPTGAALENEISRA